VIEVREVLGGDVDEIIADQAKVHLEIMDDDHVWMSIEDINGKRIMVNFHSDSPIEILVEDD